MTQVICLLLGLSLVPVVALAEDKDTGGLTDPIEIFKKADAAAKAVKAVKYDVTFEGTGAFRERVGKLTGTFIVKGWEGGQPAGLRAEIEAERREWPEPKKISLGGDGDMFFVVDHAAKKAYEDLDPAVIGSFGRLAMAGLMAEFVHPTPFSDEINSKKQELTGSKKIGEEDCYEIHVVYATERTQEAIWYFSKKDFLPRGRIDKFNMPDGAEAAQQKMITNLVVDPKLDKDVFKLKLPEGYTKTDDFAP